MLMLTAIALTALFGAWIAFNGHQYRENKKKNFDSYLQQEMEANYARRKDVEASYFYMPDISILPIRDYPEAKAKLIKKQANVLLQAKKKMLYFGQKMTNTELKLKYGLANLENITIYEDNYSSYIRALTEWAEALITDQNFDDGVLILEECVRLGSELSKGYILLAEAYNNRSDLNKLNDLSIIVADNMILNSVTKDRILARINELKGN